MTIQSIKLALNENRISLSKHFAERASERGVTQTQILNLFKSFKLEKAKSNKWKIVNAEIKILISDDFCLITTYSNS